MLNLFFVLCIKYDTYDLSGVSLYADAGQYTVQIIEKYNEKFQQNITITQILQDLKKVNDALNCYIKDGFGDHLHDIHFGN